MSVLLTKENTLAQIQAYLAGKTVSSWQKGGKLKSPITKSMGHRALKGAVCHRPSILGMFRIENKIGYYRRLKSAVFNSDIRY